MAGAIKTELGLTTTLVIISGECFKRLTGGILTSCCLCVRAKIDLEKAMVLKLS